MRYTTGQLAALTGAELYGDCGLWVSNIAFDSRIIYTSNETAFVAINTSKNSGEKFINEAVKKGISIIISEKAIEGHPEVTFLKTDSTVEFLRILAKKHLAGLRLKTIGITGSNGKTILKEWLFQSLWQDFKTVKSPKSFNSVTGLPLSILQANQEHELGIFEVGISNPGEMERQTEIFNPQIGILTYIGTAHSGNYASEEELVAEKLKLFEKSKTIIFNGDNELVFNKVKASYSDKELFSFGFNERNDIHVLNVGPLVMLSVNGGKFRFPAQQRDNATLLNVMALVAVLKLFGFENEAIIKKIAQLQSVEMRLEAVNGVRNNLIINDSFNLDLDSLKIALQYIQHYSKRQKALVITDIVDGNRNSAALYAEAAGYINEQGFSKIFLIGEEIVRYTHLFEGKTERFNNVEDLAKSQVINELSDAVILLKGARKFGIEKLKTQLEAQKHDTVLEVNLNRILHNINIHRALLQPSTKIMAMVKAFSYGLGGYEIAEFLQHHHIDYLGVAYADEGAELRKNGITVPIMVMNPEQSSYDAIIDYGLEPEIYSFRVLDLFIAQLQKKGITQPYPVHLKLETGMHRLGLKKNDIPALLLALKVANVRVVSIFSHLATADMPEEAQYVHAQAKEFSEMTAIIADGLGYRPFLHLLNSSGITEFPQYQYDMVRIGIGMMGISVNPDIQGKLQNVVTFKTVISQISELEQGETLGYGRNYKAQSQKKIATIPVGYADGIPRLLGNKNGFVGIKGKKYPIAGNVCMDMIMVELDNAQISEGEEVILFNSNPSLTEFAQYCQTIPYEVLTSISRRVKRIYIKD